MTTTISFPRPTEVPKLWGKEVHLFNSPDYCAKFLDFRAGGRGSLHFHSVKRESWAILSGEVELTYVETDTGTTRGRRLRAGDLVDIPRNCPHQVTALEDTRIIEVSTQDFPEDSYRIIPSAASVPLKEGWKS